LQCAITQGRSQPTKTKKNTRHQIQATYAHAGTALPKKCPDQGDMVGEAAWGNKSSNIFHPLPAIIKGICITNLKQLLTNMNMKSNCSFQAYLHEKNR